MFTTSNGSNVNLCPPYVVFTDLDGTLFHHYTYEWQPALSAIKRLQALEIPIVINSSKTAAEVIPLRKTLGLHSPFIVENGSALYIPKGFCDEAIKQLPTVQLQGDYYRALFGADRNDIVQCIYQQRASRQLKFSGYSDWDTKSLMSHTGLDKTSAEQSLERLYSEPIIWQDSEAAHDEFADYIAQKGLQILSGGRFEHILGDTDKAQPIRFFREHIYQDKKTKFICLGDTQNDTDMLELADIAVCIKSPVCPYPVLKNEHVYHSQKYAPEGWQEAIDFILARDKSIGDKTQQ